MTRPDDLLSYCQLAIRAVASRGLAYERWRKFHRTSRREFEKVWAVAGRPSSCSRQRAG